jgi:hypothetical protein
MRDLASNDRAEALQAVRLAVWAYARDPSCKNEAGVEEALRRARRLDSVERWRGSKTALQAAHQPRPGTLENQYSPLIHQIKCYTKSLKSHSSR